MTIVATIGFQKKSLAEFVGLLQQAGVEAVIDIRLRNTSQLAGYSKRDDLAFLLEEGFSIAYEHRPELAPSDEILDAYRADKDWAAYEARFLPLLAERRAELTGQEILTRYNTVCLLCSESAADRCHRRLVAEYWARHDPGLVVTHL